MFGLFRAKGVFDDTAIELYEQCLQASLSPVFYRDYGVADTFDGRFEVLVLHLCLLNQRLIKDGEQGELVQALFDITFASLDQALRNEGVGDMGVPKRIRKMMLVFNSRMHGYSDACLSGTLAEMLRDTLYGSYENISADHVNAMVSYIVRSIGHIEALSIDDILNGSKIF